MANVTEISNFDAGVYRIETTDLVVGGENGLSNKGIKNLANRTKYLKDHMDTAESDISTLETNLSTAQSNIAGVQFLRAGVVNLTVDQTPETTVDFDELDCLYNVTNSAGAAQNSIINLPSAGAVSNGWPVAFAITGGNNTATVQIKATSGQTIADVRGGQALQSITLRLGDHVTMFSNGSNKWIAFVENNDMTGAVSAFAMSVAPSGWMKANGAAISRTTYARLFAVIGTTFGVGDGSTTFNVPDMRGEFVRGLDDSRGIDTSTIALACNTTNASASVTVQDGTSGLFVGMAVSGTGIPANTTISAISSRTVITLSANATATNTGTTLTFTSTRTLGSAQADMLKKHEHFYASRANIVNGASPTTATLIDWDGATTAEKFAGNTEYVGGLETRPRNIALLYCVKY